MKVLIKQNYNERWCPLKRKQEIPFTNVSIQLNKLKKLTGGNKVIYAVGKNWNKIFNGSSQTKTNTQIKPQVNRQPPPRQKLVIYKPSAFMPFLLSFLTNQIMSHWACQLHHVSWSRYFWMTGQWTANSTRERNAAGPWRTQSCSTMLWLLGIPKNIYIYIK